MDHPERIESDTNIFILKLNEREPDDDDLSGYQFKRIHSLDRFGHIIRKFLLLETEYGVRMAVFFDGFFIHLPHRLTKKITRQHELQRLNDLVSRSRVVFTFGGYDEAGKLKIKFRVNPSLDEIISNDVDFFDY